MNINLPNFNVKNLVKEAGSTLSRVVQLTEEKLGTTERTEYDNEFQNLAERADITKAWTEKIVRDTETVLIPNPQNRIEDFIFEKIEKTKPQRLSNLEHLALDMIEAGGDFGQDLPYGQALIKVGQAEQKLGQCERDFIASSGICFTQPLRKFLDGEMKTITKERGLLETKRLDLDACKNRVKKARSMLGQQTNNNSNEDHTRSVSTTVGSTLPKRPGFISGQGLSLQQHSPYKDGVSPEAVLEQAERELRVAQAEFDRQAEITKVLLEGISTSQASHLRHLHAFVETQVRYYKHCIDTMNNLQRDLANLGGPTPYAPIDIYNDDDGSGNHSASSGIGLNAGGGGSSGAGIGAGSVVGAGSGGRRRNPGDPILNADQMRRARVLCAYDAKDHTELNLNANEVIFVTECSPVNPDYMYGKQGLLKGLVPRAFLEMLEDEENDTNNF